MKKESVDVKNQFIPHPMQLFAIGTYNPDQSENFGVFCWINFCWDEELCVTVCMDGEKQTKTNIMEQRIFSANLIDERILPWAKKLAYSKTDEKDKLLKRTNVSRGQVLNVPILEDSSYCYELEVKKTINLDGSELFICAIRNTLVFEELISTPEKYDVLTVKPVGVSQGEFYVSTRV